MTYCTEVHEDTSKTKNMLRVAEMKTLRIIVGENKERQSEKHGHQGAMQNIRYSEMGKAA